MSLELEADNIMADCKHLGASFKRIVHGHMGKQKTLQAGDCLVFWTFDLLVSMNLFPMPQCEEGLLAFLEETLTSIMMYGGRLEVDLFNQEEEIPISELVICDRRWVGLVGSSALIDIQTGEFSSKRIGQFLERINYSLATLYIRQRTKYLSEARNNAERNPISDDTAVPA